MYRPEGWKEKRKGWLEVNERLTYQFMKTSYEAGADARGVEGEVTIPCVRWWGQ